MRISAFIVSSFCLAVLPCHGQDPGAQQDEEAAREKLLKASDQLDNIQANSESTKASVEGMKADVTKLQADVTALQSDNAALKSQVADLQAALDQAEAQRVKERQILLDEVAKMVAAGKGSKSGTKKKDTSTSASAPAPPPEPKPDSDTSGTASGLTPPPDTPSNSPAPASTGDATASPPDTPPAPKPQKGYYHIVESGETLTMICAAYRDNGINVTVSQIKKANGLTDATMLRVGQKLFIPKPAN